MTTDEIMFMDDEGYFDDLNDYEKGRSFFANADDDDPRGDYH